MYADCSMKMITSLKLGKSIITMCTFSCCNIREDHKLQRLYSKGNYHSELNDSDDMVFYQTLRDGYVATPVKVKKIASSLTLLNENGSANRDRSLILESPPQQEIEPIEKVIGNGHDFTFHQKNSQQNSESKTLTFQKLSHEQLDAYSVIQEEDKEETTKSNKPEEIVTSDFSKKQGTVPQNFNGIGTEAIKNHAESLNIPQFSDASQLITEYKQRIAVIEAKHKEELIDEVIISSSCIVCKDN